MFSRIPAPGSNMMLVPLKQAQANPEIRYRGLYEDARGPNVVEFGLGIRSYVPAHGVSIPLVPLKEAQRNAAIKYRGL
ncbi:hypothetical protein EVJ58_g25 [Rhodofomes roseus]|uniref:Uncharacterized protein n=1 Tax=Rhodofomes roseus TaxID=34475 RepID=A0A4Y9Z5Q3_9APHY|nr:hypothetical protein EVJ58_g25 [Rhodofomes roseus]